MTARNGITRRVVGAALGQASFTKRPQEKQLVTVTYKCGHEGEVEILGDPTRSRYLMAIQDRDCTACWRASVTAADDKAVAAGKRAPLEGSEKQAAFAAGVRQRRAESLGLILNAIKAEANVLVTAKRLTRDVAVLAVKEVQDAVTDLMMGNIDWTLPSGNEVSTATARFWLDMRPHTGDDGQPAGLTDRQLLGVLLPHRNFASSTDDTDWSAVFAVREVEPQAEPEEDDDFGFDDFDRPLT